MVVEERPGDVHGGETRGVKGDADEGVPSVSWENLEFNRGQGGDESVAGVEWHRVSFWFQEWYLVPRHVRHWTKQEVKRSGEWERGTEYGDVG